MTIIKIKDKDNTHTHNVESSIDELELRLTNCFEKKLFIIIKTENQSTIYHSEYLQNCIIELSTI